MHSPAIRITPVSRYFSLCLYLFSRCLLPGPHRSSAAFRNVYFLQLLFHFVQEIPSQKCPELILTVIQLFPQSSQFLSVSEICLFPQLICYFLISSGIGIVAFRAKLPAFQHVNLLLHNHSL